MEKRNGNLSGVLHLVTIAAALVGIIIGALAYNKDGQDLTRLNKLDARVTDLEPKEPVLPSNNMASKWSVENPDPTLFKWNGPVKPNTTACGFLTVPLSYAPQHLEKPFPEVPRAKKGMPRTQVYLCMAFATESLPAKRGTAFVHCGGPDSTSKCGMNHMHSKEVQSQVHTPSQSTRSLTKCTHTHIRLHTQYGYTKTHYKTHTHTHTHTHSQTHSHTPQLYIPARTRAYSH
jgi:hypothetical protein